MGNSTRSHPIIGFIKFQNQIGLYRADYDAWILDIKAFCSQFRIGEETFTGRKDGRFVSQLQRPIRQSDKAALVAWFEKHAALDHQELADSLNKLGYGELDVSFEDQLPVVLYDFDELTSFENPDLNPYTPFDDFLPEGWKNVVVEGFDALVPDEYNYWSRFAARLDVRAEDTL